MLGRADCVRAREGVGERRTRCSFITSNWGKCREGKLGLFERDTPWLPVPEPSEDHHPPAGFAASSGSALQAWPSFQHLHEPHRYLLHPELLNTEGWKTRSGKRCPRVNSHRVVFSTVQMSQEHLRRESVDLWHPWFWQNFTFHGSFPPWTGNCSFDATTCDSAPSLSLQLTARSFKVRAADCWEPLFHLGLSH